MLDDCKALPALSYNEVLFKALIVIASSPLNSPVQVASNVNVVEFAKFTELVFVGPFTGVPAIPFAKSVKLLILFNGA